MSASSPRVASASASASSTSAFWERLWRGSGIFFLGFFVIAYALYGTQPGVGASSDAVAAFYQANRARILIAVVISGLNILNLMWFAAALRATLTDLGQDGWGAAATAASAALGALLVVLLAIPAALAFSISAGSPALASGLNDFAWALLVVTSFPRAMLVMSGVFGFWRAGVISNALFTAGVGAVVLGVLGGTTWLGGFWAPDGAYSRFVAPLVGLAWVAVMSWLLLAKSPATRAKW